MQSVPTGSAFSRFPLLQDSSIANGSGQISAGISSTLRAKNKSLRQKVSHGSVLSRQSSFVFLCFQSGVGWQRSLPNNFVENTIQAAPALLETITSHAQQSSRHANSNDCDGAISISNASSKPLGTFNSHSVSPTATSATSDSKSEMGTASLLLQSSSGESLFSFSDETNLTSLSIMPSISQTGDMVFSMASPELIPGASDSSALTPSTGVAAYSFSPGRGGSNAGSASGEEVGHVKWSALENERNKTIGHESDELKSQEKKAIVEVPVSASDLHAYLQLRYLCLKVVQAQQAGTIPDDLNAQLNGGQKATELNRMRDSCAQFLLMGRGAVIRKMQRHNGLK
jgi:hypothetical protein